MAGRKLINSVSDENIEKEGLDTSWYPTGEKLEEVYFENGKKDGVEEIK